MHSSASPPLRAIYVLMPMVDGTQGPRRPRTVPSRVDCVFLDQRMPETAVAVEERCHAPRLAKTEGEYVLF